MIGFLPWEIFFDGDNLDEMTTKKHKKTNFAKERRKAFQMVSSSLEPSSKQREMKQNTKDELEIARIIWRNSSVVKKGRQIGVETMVC